MATNDRAPVLLLTVEEAAFALAISRRRVYELVKAGELQTVTIGRLMRFSVAELDRFISRNKTTELMHESLSRQMRELRLQRSA